MKKAFILAAGLGTRLKPYTLERPKPLFPIGGRLLLDITIRKLIREEFGPLLLNTHHLADQIKTFIRRQPYAAQIQIFHETRILGTGGALKNAAQQLQGQAPFIVINADILTDIDCKAAYTFHCTHPHPVTMVLHDCPQFNTVYVDDRQQVTGFQRSGGHTTATSTGNRRRLAFTGIHVIDPMVLDKMPAEAFVDIIDVYETLIASGHPIQAYIARNHYWNDVGTPRRYRQAVLDHLLPQAFQTAGGAPPSPAPQKTQLKGDGSDRKWYRVATTEQSLILVDHGIRTGSSPQQVDAFIDIGNHLYRQGAPLPRIRAHDRFAGLVLLQDLGQRHLQDVIRAQPVDDKREVIYQHVIDQLIKLSIDGHQGFDPAWTYQSKAYDQHLILDKECRYFIEAFVQTYMGLEESFDKFRAEFEYLAEGAVRNAINGFMHRDLQSRNIMWWEDKPYFIDFQGGRTGPIQYDLASLLIDPYVQLTPALQSRLLTYAVTQYHRRQAVNQEVFFKGYRYCAICRNLQMLGAFGYLSRVKNKPVFETYIPPAVRNLSANMNAWFRTDFPLLCHLADTLSARLAQPMTTRKKL